VILRSAVPRLLSYADESMDVATSALAEELLAVAVCELWRSEAPSQLMAMLRAVVELGEELALPDRARAMAAEVIFAIGVK